MSTRPEFWDRLQTFADQPDEEPSPRRLAYRRRAALVAWFDGEDLANEPSEHEAGPPDPELLTFLAEDCRRVTDASGRRHWTMKDPVRRAALAQIAATDELRTAAAELPSRPSDPVQRALDAMITGQQPTVEDPPRVRWRAMLQAADWLDGLIEGLPNIASLHSSIALADLLDPLRELLSGGFEGRQGELDTLREYVGVLPPGSLGRKIRSAFLRKIKSLGEQPPLLIWGPGGIGKSTLVAKFVIDHYDSVDAEDKFPFAYLNFDRSTLDPERPASIIAEVLRQLSLQYPQLAQQIADAIEVIGRSERSGEVPSRPIYLEGSDVGRAQATRRLIELVQGIATNDRPLLLVLDTFEEVQRRGSAALASIWRELDELQQGLPMLRVVLAGRSVVYDFATKDLLLSDFDELAARAYLQARVPDLKSLDMRRILRKVGGNPLRLRLTAQVLADPAEDRSLAFLRIDQALVTTVLYDRILDHIADPEVRKIAHPGLVVRRITPEIIREVLAENCGLEGINTERAEGIFARFETEVALVEHRAEDPDALYHRLDVRQLMLAELRQSMPEIAAAIDVDAVRYYAGHDGSVERAEELYHRMMLGDSTDILRSRWTEEAGQLLVRSFDELPTPAQMFIAARVGIEIDDAIRQAAETEEWRLYTAGEARRLAMAGRPQDALSLIAERRGARGESLLPAIEAQLLEQRGDLHAALGVCDEWLNSTVEQGHSSEFAQASLSCARLTGRAHGLADASSVLNRARDTFVDSLENTDLLRVDAALLRVCRVGELELPAGLPGEAVELADSAGPVVLSAQPSLLRELAAEIGPSRPWLLATALRRVSLDPDDPPSGWGRLAAALVLWERTVSSERALPPAVLRREAHVPEVDGVEIFSEWYQWAVDSPVEVTTTWLARLMDQFSPPHPEVCQVVADMYRDEVDSDLGTGEDHAGMRDEAAEAAPEAMATGDDLVSVLERNRHRFPTQRKPNIIVCGQIGVGKTTTINTLFGDEVGKVGYFSRGSEKDELYEWESHGHSIDVVDLPGMGDTPRRDKVYAEMYRRRVQGADGFIVVINPPRPAVQPTFKTVNLLLTCGVDPERIVFGYNRLSNINVKIGGKEHAVSINGIAGPGSQQDVQLIEEARKAFNDDLRHQIRNGRHATRFRLEKVVPYDAASGWNLFAVLDSVLETLPGDALVKWRDAVNQAARDLQRRAEADLKGRQQAYDAEIADLRRENAELAGHLQDMSRRKKRSGARKAKDLHGGQRSTPVEFTITEQATRLISELARTQERAEALEAVPAQHDAHLKKISNRLMRWIEETLGLPMASIKSAMNRVWNWFKGK